MATLQDYYNTGDGANAAFGSARWIAQTFTAGNGYSISSIKLKLWRDPSNNPGTITISIRATTAGLPTGADLDGVSGTTDGNTLPTTQGTAEWREITLSSSIELTSSVMYAIVMRCSGVNPSCNCRDDASSPAYANGTYNYSNNSGSSWTIFSGADLMFETWGDAPVTHEAEGSISGTGSITADAEGTWCLGGSVVGSGGLVGDAMLNTSHEAEGVVTGLGGMAGTLVTERVVEGSIAGIGTLTGLFFVESFIWAKSRAASYDKTKVYDEATQTWIISDSRGGSRFRNQLIVMAKQDDGNAKLFYSDV